jgi:hypothetical protein
VVAASSVFVPVGWSPVEGRPLLFGVVLINWWYFFLTGRAEEICRANRKAADPGIGFRGLGETCWRDA